MNKKIYPCIVALSTLVLLNGCEKKEVYVNPEQEQVETVPVDLKFSISRLEEAIHVKQEGHRDFNYLGYGYDVTKKYAHASAVRSAVVNTPAYAHEHPYRFLILRLSTSGFRPLFSINATHFLTSLSARIQDKPLSGAPHYFAGNITEVFQNNDAGSSAYLYGLYEQYSYDKRYSMMLSSNDYAAYETAAFLADKEVLSAAALVNKYGTHIITTLYTGAKLSLFYQGKYEGKHREQAVANSFRLGLEQSFGFFSGQLDPMEPEFLKGLENPKIKFEAIGGDPNKIMVDQSESVTKVSTSAWRTSIDFKENARFVSFGEIEKSLVPIDDFFQEGTKKQEIKSYVANYIKDNALK